MRKLLVIGLYDLEGSMDEEYLNHVKLGRAGWEYATYADEGQTLVLSQEPFTEAETEYINNYVQHTHEDISIEQRLVSQGYTILLVKDVKEEYQLEVNPPRYQS